ncbi:uncharacterized protein BP5553_07957 [Venustampulla echinocandica]|uniref:Uncharacterized protein n=1 Tax=Venustampulla echinocandica TaxID=2656787 RepID=A0A370TFA2_9HELO|nr:uncharacterized protein BP5553_07957 [Venustampulla echinocandica]RDL33589.1 hypothetical protein BP5553_07957 [Venustampulla echinocandica]
MKGIYLGSLALAFLGVARAEDLGGQQIITTYEMQVVTSQLLITTRVPLYITLTDSAGSATATIATNVSLAGPTPVVSSALVAVGTATSSVPLTTSTVTSTILETITSCISNPRCTNGHIVTRTTVFTTTCPVTQVGDSTVVLSSTRTVTAPTSIALGKSPSGSLNATGTTPHPTTRSSSTEQTTSRSIPTVLPPVFNSSLPAGSASTTQHSVTTTALTKALDTSKSNVDLSSTTDSGAPTTFETGVIANPSTSTSSPTSTITVPCETTYVNGGLVPFHGVPVQAGARVTMEGTIYSFPADASGSIRLAHRRPSGFPVTASNGTHHHQGRPTGSHKLPTSSPSFGRPIPTARRFRPRQ